MNIQIFYNENGRTFEDILKDYILLYYNLENLDFIEKYA